MTEDAQSQRVINAAIRLAIEALKDYRRRHFSIGHNAFMKGQIFIFTEKDHHSYEKYTRAIDCLAGLIKDIPRIDMKERKME